MPVGGPKKKGGQKEKAKKQQKQDKKTAKNAGKDQALSDKTFGLKNKKGAKGKQFVQQTTMQLKGHEINVSQLVRLYNPAITTLKDANFKAAKKKAEDRKKQKELKAREEEAAKALFGSMEKTVRGKDGKKLTRAQISAMKKAEEEKAAELKRKKELWDTLTLEEKIEHKRAQLDTTLCTPVTPENFAVWKAAKRAKKEAAEDARVAAIKAGRKGKHKNKDMKVTGRDLFKLDSSLFKDDASSLDTTDILAMVM